VRRTRPATVPVLQLEAGTGESWLAAFMSRVAEALRSAPAHSAVLIEQWWDGRDGEVRLLPFSEPLHLLMESLREGLPLRWSRVSRDRACQPPAEYHDAWLRIRLESRPPSPAGPRENVPPSRPPKIGSDVPVPRLPAHEVPRPIVDLLPLGHAYWVAVQSHWIADPDGQVWLSLRGRIAAASQDDLPTLRTSVETHLRRLLGSESGWEVTVDAFVPRSWHRRAWASGARPGWAGPPATCLRPDLLGLAVAFPLSSDPRDDPRLRHCVVLGASGSGKTSALAELARGALAERRSVVLFDVHGDLAPRVVAGLPSASRGRLIAIDVAGNPTLLPGLSVFGPVPPADREALVAHLVAAFKRLSTENGETFWGFRLERIFETFLHVVQEQGGDLVDLWSLLTDPRRRDAARLTTERAEVAQFLEELEGIVRRQPDFLWPAASRVAKVVGSPLLTALLAPKERSVEFGARLRPGQSMLWRLPMGELGPEGVTFAVTLLLSRVYLDEVRHAAGEGPASELRVLFVLDEAHLFPARLLSEIIAEGRKFGLGLVMATQYPARLAPELREALTGAAGTVQLFRVPWASAAATGAWAGLPPEAAQNVLPFLPAGWAVQGSTGPGADRRIVATPPAPPPDLPAWRGLVRRSADRFGSPVPYRDEGGDASSASQEEELLLGLVALEAGPGPATRARLLGWLDGMDGFDPVTGLETLETLVRRGWVRAEGEGLLLSAAGRDRVGLTVRTDARRESAEHRALLVTALRIFARHRERLEILRQGRFDTRLPDGRVTVLPRSHRRWGPAELASYLDRRRGTWLWRAFGGRDVQVEAEVSGATRRQRVERDWMKARDAGAFLLILVGDTARARSVRRFLTGAGVSRTRATVWTLRTVRAVSEIEPPT
jgi:hypothetical protein